MKYRTRKSVHPLISTLGGFTIDLTQQTETVNIAVGIGRRLIVILQQVFPRASSKLVNVPSNRSRYLRAQLSTRLTILFTRFPSFFPFFYSKSRNSPRPLSRYWVSSGRKTRFSKIIFRCQYMWIGSMFCANYIRLYMLPDNIF